MVAVTLGIKVDEMLRSRIKEAATTLGKTSHWLLKQAVIQYVENLERGYVPQVATAGATDKVEIAEAEDVADLKLVGIAPSSVPQPFLDWAQNVLPQTALRSAITSAWTRPEPECLPLLVQLAQVTDPLQRAAIEEVATRLVQGLRSNKDGYPFGC